MKFRSLTNHVCDESNARQFADWILTRGGLCVWPSVNLSNPGASWTTPRYTRNGVLVERPTWQAANEPERIITSLDEVDVVRYEEVKRFHVGVMGSQGLNFKVTDGGTRRIRRELARAGDGATYVFDYSEQSAVILKPAKTVTLAKYMETI